MAYITQDDVAALLGDFDLPAHWTEEGGSAESQIDAAIGRAKEVIDAFCGNTFEPVTRTIILNGSGAAHLGVVEHTRYPINTITSITERDNYDDEWLAANIVASDGYVINPSRRYIERIDGELWTLGRSNYRLIGTFGRNGIPANVKKAAVLLVREEISPGHIQQYESLQSESFSDGYSYSRGQRGGTQAAYGPTTGFAYIDALLCQMRNRMPGLGAIGIR